jgi:hypothetical protein
MLKTFGHPERKKHRKANSYGNSDNLYSFLYFLGVTRNKMKQHETTYDKHKAVIDI